MNIAIVGTGYVGLVTGACLASRGHSVVCVDRVKARVDAVRSGAPLFHEPGLPELIADSVSGGALSATTDLNGAVLKASLIMIAVDTPDAGGEIDLSRVEGAARDIGRALAQDERYRVVVVKSTVLPGTTDGRVREILEQESGKRCGAAFGLAANPEFLREGSAVRDFMTPDRIVIGEWDKPSGEALGGMYAGFDAPVLRMTTRNAELIKYASNALLANLISYSNEIAELCEATPGTDAVTVLDGVHLDRRLSSWRDGERIPAGIVDYLRAGSGYGGSCLPKDVTALHGFAKSRGLRAPLLASVLSINQCRPRRVVDMAEILLGGLEGRLVAVLGLAFKPGTDDLRDSPALRIIGELHKRGARVRACDPLAREAAGGVLDAAIELVEADIAAVSGADAAIIATASPEFRAWDWDAACKSMAQAFVVDGRGALADMALPSSMKYRPIGKYLDPTRGPGGEAFVG